MERPSLLSRVFSTALFCGLVGTLLLQPFLVSAAGDGPSIRDKAGIPGYPAVSITENLPERINAIYENIRWELIGAGTMAFMNAMQTFFGQLAYDAADYIASGGKGQSAMFYEKGFEGYLKDVAGSAAGEFIGSLSQASFFQTIGFDLCRPPDPRTLLRIQLSLGGFFGQNVPSQAYQRPQARCEFNDIIRNYEQVYQTLSNKDIISNVEASISTNSNDLGVSFLIFNRAANFVTQRRENAREDRKEGDGYQALRDMVSGRVRTPAETIREQANEMLVKNPRANQEQVNSFILEQAWNLGPQKLAVYTASVFLNTLASKSLRRVMDEGIDLSNLFKQKTFNVVRNPDDLLEGTREDARKANISLRTPNLFQDRAYDVLAEMQGCPQNRGTWNCVIDEGLAQALRSEGDAGAYTIQEALDRKYLHDEWRLFPSSNTREEQDPLCYTYGYCAGNLRKLRLMRILPVGFEFAANDRENVSRCSSDRGCITLGEVVDGYTSCNERGERDEAHPWCKLIDPNWALTLMPQQCALSGFGDVMLSPDLPQRREECQDIQTCLRRNDKGECVGGYGYCVTEKASYRFGAQECSARYASCRTYQSRSGAEASYLRNSLDYGGCSEDTVGCLWYATTRDTSGGAEEWIGTPSVGPRVYFDKTMETCTAEQAGCTSLLAVPQGASALNLVSNSSFERTAEGTGKPEDWEPLRGNNPSYVRPVPDVGEAAANGANAAHFSGGFQSGYRQVVEVVPSRTMVFSAYVRRYKTEDPTERLSLGIIQYPSREAALQRRDGLKPPAVGRDYRSGECVMRDTDAGAMIGPNAEPYFRSTNWVRIECALVTNQSAKAAEVVIEGANTLVDAVMFEEGASATAYMDGVNSRLAQVYQKIAPDEFACSGTDTDHPSCANYARMCKQSEAGCDGYTDLSSNLPEVTAQLNRGDLCPAACVGYAEYRKMASSFDLIRSTNEALNDQQEPSAEYFIPSSAEQCTQEAAGCELFTVVDNAQQGGESTAAYASLRFCETPGNDTDTYFTWEGSDAAGYQLRTWALKKRTNDKPGLVPPEGATISPNPGPRIIVKPAGDLFSQKDPLNCNETAWRGGGDPDCRQFYNAGGAVYYRYYSQTVLSTNECRQFRLASTNRDDCQKTGGTYNETANTCTYMAYGPESRSCQASFAGCRAYAGAEAGNTYTVFSANGTPASGAVERTTRSNESLVVGDSSYRYDVPSNGTMSPFITVTTTVSGLYRISFWIKATAPVAATVATVQEGGGAEHVVATAAASGEWKRVTFGLFSGETGSRSRIEFRTAAGSSAAAVFIDEIIVQQVRDIVFVKRGTWNTPAQCDQTAYGVPEPQAMLGCKQYQNRTGQSVAARQFSRLCRPSAVGCRAFIDTRNSSEPYRKVISLVDGGQTSETVAPADRYMYLIDDPAKRCDADGVMCKAFGKPIFSKNRQAVEAFETVYLKDDVRQYGEGLCKPSEVFCEEFTTAVGREYFKDPQNHLCEYRERVNIVGFSGVADGLYSGWFVKGKSTPCYPDALASGQEFLLLKTGDRSPGAGYEGWGGVCPVEESECTEFRDPNDKTNVSSGRSYYFIKDDRIDTRSCNNAYDPSRGCVLVRDMSNASLKFSLNATQKKYQREGMQSVQPVDCAQDPNQPGCTAAATGRCVGSRVTSVYQANAEGNGFTVARSSVAYAGGACARDEDCAAEAELRQSPDTIQYRISGGIVNGQETFINRTRSRSESRVEGIRCDRPTANDANAIVKVRMDRDCAQWLGCASGETVFDPATNRYRELCTQVALCDKGSSQGGAGSYCANYVNRTGTSTEPVLVAGGYFDANTYASRPTGVGSRDYSGYAIPAAFQVADLASRGIEKDIRRAGIGSREEGGEKRFVVTVKMPPFQASSLVPNSVEYRHLFPPRAHQARALSPNHAAYAGMPAGSVMGGREIALCRHEQSGVIGYFNLEEARNTQSAPNCYFSFRDSSETNDFFALATRYAALSRDDQDVRLDEAYPKSMCRAHPENDAPFSSAFVAKWDTVKNPIQPLEVKAGYARANFCAFGEDCSCSYKRVEYPGKSTPMFFAWDSQAVPPGICIGGPRDGQACLPSEVYDISASTSTSVSIANSANNAQTCGPASAGGRCAAFSKAEIVRGVQGSCLEYDTTRPRGKVGEMDYSCLTWNPAPVVGGKNDPYRYVETAGYFPPQNSGQYYCTSEAKSPSNINLVSGNFHPDLLPVGITMEGLGYDDDYVSDAHELASDGNKSGAYLGGIQPSGSAAANKCEEADDSQDDDGPFDRDPFGIRLVGTGRGQGASYTETFFGVNPAAIASALYGTSDPLNEEKIRQAMYDRNFSFIEVRPFENPNGNGRLACGYQEEWVDGVHVQDYDKADEVAQADRRWREAFFAEEDLQMHLTRGTEQVILDPTTRQGTAPRPLAMPCVNLSDGSPTRNAAELLNQNCYFKTWEGGYRSTGKEDKFTAFTDGQYGSGYRSTGFSGLINSMMKECRSEKPYYAIRAVFQTSAAAQTQRDQLEPRNVRGPWRFVGFWVSSCAGSGTSDNRGIYMNVRLQSADICRELAEVRSVKTKQDAAFTDRVWRESKYTVPMLNIGYGQSFAPFSSALNTGPAGEDPLYQTGGRLAGASALRPPTFLASGFSTYYGTGAPGTPKDRYAFLSNLFARIYRVYTYNEQRIGPEDRVCEKGPQVGRRCVPDAQRGETPETGPSVDCRPAARATTCNTATSPNYQICNALSGINAGRAPSSADLCHTAPLDPRPGRTNVPLLGTCQFDASKWEKNPNNAEEYRLIIPGRRNPNDPYISRQEAALNGAFRCGAGSVRLLTLDQTGQLRQDNGTYRPPTNDELVQARRTGSVLPLAPDIRDRETGLADRQQDLYCTVEAEASEECPIEVIGTCVKPQGAAPTATGVCTARWTQNGSPVEVRTSNRCVVDNNCAFNATHFWRIPEGATWRSQDEQLGIDGGTNGGPYFDGRMGVFLSPRSAATNRSGLGAGRSSPNHCTGNVCQFSQFRDAAASTPIVVPIRDDVGAVLATELDLFPGASRIGAVPVGDLPNYAYATVGPLTQYTLADGQYKLSSLESLRTMLASVQGLRYGTCSEGSNRQGQLCITPNPEAGPNANRWATADYSCGVIEPVAEGMDLCKPVSVRGGTRDAPSYTPVPDCQLNTPPAIGVDARTYYDRMRIPPSAQTLNNDNNTCTMEVGYRPDPKLCPNPNSEFCGLISYDMRASGGDQNSLNRRSTTGIKLPTDVTLGHYTPSYLGFTAEEESASNYIEYYTPKPPRIASPVPDCPTGSSCGVQDLDRFSFNGVTEGILNVVGGQHRSSLAFFGWAAHEQMALRALSVDWGDGTVEAFEDVRLKNHKPYCAVQKECYAPDGGFTGATCQSDNDCPITAQACRQMGSCKEKQHIVCAQDEDCRRDGSQDRCETRAFFGNNGDACEASPFMFSHAYTCSRAASELLPRCTGRNYTLSREQQLAMNIPSEVVAPTAERPGTCFFGTVDQLVTEAIQALDRVRRPACSLTNGQQECQVAYRRASGVAPDATIDPDILRMISCGPPTIAGAPAVLTAQTQGRCSRDTTRFCAEHTDCAVGDRCIAAGLAPPGGCWDEINGACRYTPRVFLQDNWGWCTGECRTTERNGRIADATNAYVRHPYGGCYTPTPIGGSPEQDSVRLNTQGTNTDRWTSEIAYQQQGRPVGLECAQALPAGTLTGDGTRVTNAEPERSLRPWVVFPGSLQLRP